MILDPITLFGLDGCLEVVPINQRKQFQLFLVYLHSLVVDAPVLAEDFTLFVSLASEVITKLP